MTVQIRNRGQELLWSPERLFRIAAYPAGFINSNTTTEIAPPTPPQENVLSWETGAFNFRSEG